MPARSVKTVRALERGLSLLEHLHGSGALSLGELHRATGLPKATLERLLLTLHEQGWAQQRLADGKWVPSGPIRSLAIRLPPKSRLGQAATPVMEQLCRRVIWPSDLSVRVGTHMELTETSRPHSRLTLAHITVGFPVHMLLSAPGRAYIAFCEDEERESILQRLAKGKGISRTLARDGAFVARLVEETRRLGYGARDESWGGHISEPKHRYDDGLNAIAVPVLHADRVLGCINIVWIRHLLTQTEMARRHLADLRSSADQIAAAFARGGQPRSRRSPSQ
ncbi:MAG: helix-turn-helix domain-containing protein [Hyphomicrobiaceae bacterium]